MDALTISKFCLFCSAVIGLIVVGSIYVTEYVRNSRNSKTDEIQDTANDLTENPQLAFPNYNPLPSRREVLELMIKEDVCRMTTAKGEQLDSLKRYHKQHLNELARLNKKLRLN